MKKFLSCLLALTLATCQPAIAQIINTLPYNLTNGSLADATQVMANYNQIVNNVNANAAHNGANSDITSITGLTTALAHSLGGTVVYTGGTSAGSANTQTLSSVSPAAFALTAGNLVTFTTGFTNLSSTTINVNSTGAKQIYKILTSGLTPLSGNELVSTNNQGGSYILYYDGTEFILVNPAPAGNAVLASGGGTFANLPTFASTFLSTGTPQIQDSGVSLAGLVGSVNYQVFPNAGSTTYTSSANTLYDIIELCGGGGGGGGVGNGANPGAAGGGGAGSYSRSLISSGQLAGAPIAVVVGSAGTAGANTGGTGGTGGPTQFGTLVSANGGVGGTGTNSTAVQVNGGAGGAAATGTITSGGQPGLPNTPGVTNLMTSGAGGSSPFGAGGQGLSQNGANTAFAGSGHCSGGGGAIGSANATGGGAGTAGFVLVTEIIGKSR